MPPRASETVTAMAVDGGRLTLVTALVLMLHVAIFVAARGAGRAEGHLDHAADARSVFHMTLVNEVTTRRAPPRASSPAHAMSANQRGNSSSAAQTPVGERPLSDLSAVDLADAVANGQPSMRSATDGRDIARLADSGNEGFEDYIDARRVTLRPALTSVVSLPEPSSDQKAGRATFTLFISTLGRAEHVRVEASNLPANIELETKQAFLSARYRPGEIDGRPVNTRLEVEIVLEPPTEPLPVPVERGYS